MWFLVLLVSTLAFVALFALVGVYAERKISAWVQDRLGPMETGPRGALQTLADIIKLVSKQSIQPSAAEASLFRLAPALVFASVFAGFAVVPLGPGAVAAAPQAGMLYSFAIISIDILGLMMAGWASNNKYALLGAFRAVAQMVSYEVPAGLTVLAVGIAFGTLSLVDVVMQQGIYATGAISFWGVGDVQAIGGVVSWGAIRYPHLLIASVVFFITGLAEANRAPFDVPEAESELVSGFHTEYGGFRFAVLMLAEYGMMLLMALLAVCMFFGGWNTPLPNLWALPPDAAPPNMSALQLLAEGQLAWLTTGAPGTFSAVAWGLLWLLGKTFGLVYLQMWVRWSFPRLRSDQLLRLCWQYLTPLATLLVLASAVWRLAESG
jgi:NADH-quinone oxidoreductase subunit H